MALNQTLDGFVSASVTSEKDDNVGSSTHSVLSLSSQQISNIEPEDGYSLPLYGLADGTFYTLHVPALACISVSFISAVAILAYSFTHQKVTTFFSWTASERFVVYMAVCDALFNTAHFSDHFHIVLTKRHPAPTLCVLYGFMLAEFISAQNLMVKVIAINVFVTVYFRKKLKFGRWDHRLHVYIFGLPALGALVAVILDTLGPNGSFCYFDGVKGQTAGIFFTTIPMFVILTIVIILYIFSWIRIYQETRQLRRSLGPAAYAKTVAHRSARTMSLFVTAYLIQWWALGLYGMWQLVAEVPQLLFNFVTTFSNIGGILNGIVFIIIMRRKRIDGKSRQYEKSVKDKANTQTITTIA